MTRNNLLLVSIALLLSAVLTGCDKNDDENTEATPRTVTQVLTVFAPGQLGDMGYADRVMKGVSTLVKADGISDSLEVNFISTDDVKTTRSQLAYTVAEQTSAVSGATYSRRLLVLTEPFMVDWLADVKSQLRPTDEVLMLKANDNDVKNAAQVLGIEGRVHGINISAASAVKHLEEARKLYYSMNESENESSILLMRLYNEQVVGYRDSIFQAILDINPDAEEDSITLSVFEKAGEVYEKEQQSTSFQKVYSLCAFMLQMAEALDSKSFTIVDCGAVNSGAEFFLIDSNQERKVVMVMLDAEPNLDLNRFSITRHFDRAVAEWTQQWLAQPTATMPQMELHGEWDGYCTDDINPLAIL